jgi:hypothetical protein
MGEKIIQLFLKIFLKVWGRMLGEYIVVIYTKAVEVYECS